MLRAAKLCKRLKRSGVRGYGMKLTEQINQDVIANKYSTLSSAVAQTASPISLENVVDTEEQYTYDCSTGKLTYTYVAYTEEDGVIIDNVVELEV